VVVATPTQVVAAKERARSPCKCLRCNVNDDNIASQDGRRLGALLCMYDPSCVPVDLLGLVRNGIERPSRTL
jgi:hypothetical protein